MTDEAKQEERVTEGDFQEQSTALAPRSGGPPMVPYSQIKSLGEAFYQSGMFTDLKSEAQAIVKIQAGLELGLGPTYAIQRLYMVEGKLGMAAETMGALMKRSGRYNYVVTEHNEQKCTIKFYEHGQHVYTSSFTMQDARRAKLVKPGSAWEKYPRALLFSRALSQGARVVAPDTMGGAYTLEELQSIQAEEKPKRGKGTLPEGVQAAESQHTGGEVETTEEPEPEGPYGHLLVTCPVHNVSWKTNKFGKRCHKAGEEWCNFRSVLKGVVESVSQKAWLSNKEDFERALKEWTNGQGVGDTTWSKLSEEQQVAFCNHLADVAQTAKDPEATDNQTEGSGETPS